MSHYPVLVLSKERKDVNSLLEPFNEYNQVERYLAYTKEELIEKSKKELLEYQEIVDNPDNFREYYGADEFNKFLEEFMVKKSWTDEEHYQYRISDLDNDNIGKDGEVYFCWNPQAEYDYYLIGGRWHSYLKLKPNATSQYVLDNVSVPGTCVSAKVKDIDFSPDEKLYAKALEEWERVFNSKQSDVTEGRQKDLLTNYGNKERYARSKSEIDAYAIITLDGKWNSYGWIGHNKFDAKDINYVTFKEKFIDTADPEWILTMVDCHYAGQCL